MDKLPPPVQIRLVTTAGGETYGVRVLERIAAVAKRQYPGFQLIEVGPELLHQRTVRIDQQIFRADQSFGHLALQDGPHFSAPNEDAGAHAELDRIIANGRVVV
ncbi:MAG TPA: hypothetical protein VNM68_04885 [Candidatus Polarisedimenticolia bacterium]|nr:hypothetical protein [Candidatus Polarisedimenticolia bacterium]